MAGLRRRARPDEPIPVPVPSRLAAPRLEDFVTDEEIQARGWPSGSLREVRGHRLVELAAHRFRDEAHDWIRDRKAAGEVYDSIDWYRAMAVANLVPLP